jgi:hypothetical protein
MTPKEALLVVRNTKAVSQNEQDMLAPLIERLRVAVTRSAAYVMEPAFAEKQRTMVEQQDFQGGTVQMLLAVP